MSASLEGDVLLPQVRLAAIYYARQHMDYLDASVRSVLPFVETVVIGVNARRPVDRESLTVVCSGSEDVRVRTRLKAHGRPGLHEAANEMSALPRIHCIEGEWKDEVECTA